MSIKKILIIQHAKHEHPAALKRALETQKLPLEWCKTYKNDPLPKSLKHIGGIISMGGPMGVNDTDLNPWIQKECEVLQEAVSQEIPVAGICLGGQLLAKALGGSVEKNSIPEVGWFNIKMTPEGKKDPLLMLSPHCQKNIQSTVYQWHYDTFYLPKGAELLAESQNCARQAFRFGKNAYGFQFHPEADHQLVHEWLNLKGVEKEILDTQKKHGSLTIQNKLEQIKHAEKAERFSLRLVAGISQLFSTQNYDPTPDDLENLNQKIETYLNQKQILSLYFESNTKKRIPLKGKIVDWFKIAGGDFIVLETKDRLRWPIRLDYLKLIEKSKPRLLQKRLKK